MVSSPRAPTKTVAGPPQFSPGERFLTVGVVAEYFGVTEVTIKNWVDAGQLLAARTVGGHRRIAASSVAKLLEQQGRSVPAGLTRRKPLVVLIEADSAWSRSVKRALTSRVRVELEADPYCALLAVARLQPEVIVVDMQLSGAEVRKLIAALRNDPQTRTIEVIASGTAATDAKTLGPLLTGPTTQRGAGSCSFVKRGELEQFVDAVCARAERPATQRTRRR